MAYDRDLANRLREQLAGEEGVTERAMFGGLAFLVGGHMAITASGRGGALVRIDPDESADALARAHTAPMVMRGRPMAGWVRVAPEGVRTARQLGPWVRRGVAYARSLPPNG